jgi:hypothetical protein
VFIFSEYSGKTYAVVGFEVLTAADVKMAVFWVVAPCRLVEVPDVSEMPSASVV